MKKFLFLSMLVVLALVAITQKAYAQPTVSVSPEYVQIPNAAAGPICLDFTLLDFTDITSMTFAFAFNPDAITLDQTSATVNTSIPGLDVGALNFDDVENGIVCFSWAESAPVGGVTLDDNMGNDPPVLFSVCFDAVDNQGNSKITILSDDSSPVEPVGCERRVTRENSGNFDIGMYCNHGYIGIGPTPLFVNIPSVSGLQNDVVCIELTVDNFQDMLSVQFSLNWDPSLLSYVSGQIVEPTNGDGGVNSPNPGEFVVTWGNDTAVSLDDGSTFVEICFDLIGGCTQEAAIELTGMPTEMEAVTEISQGNEMMTPDIGILPNNGAIIIECLQPGAPSLCLGDFSACPGEMFTVPVTTQNFTNIREMAFSMSWNDNVLELVSGYPTNFTNGMSGFGPSSFSTVGGGGLTCDWSSNNQATKPDGTVLFELKFMVIGGGGTTSSISVVSNPFQIAFTDGNNDLGYNSCNSVVDICAPQGITISAGCTVASANSDVCVPITVQDFSDVDQLSFTLNWETAIIEYTGLQNLGLVGLDVGDFDVTNSDFGILCLNWTNSTGVTLPDNTTIFDVCYTAIGDPFQVSPIDFSTSPCDEVVTQEGSSINIGLSDVSGCVEMTNPDEVEINIGNVSGPMGTEVCVDVEVENFDNIETAQFSINWNTDLLTYAGVGNEGNLDNFNSNSYSESDAFSNGNLTITWESPVMGGTSVVDGTAIFTVCFTILMEAPDCANVTVSNEPLVIEVVTATTGAVLDVITDAGEVCATPSVAINGVASELDCYGDCNGTIDVTISGGSGNNSYVWTGNGVDPFVEDQSGLCEGQYILFVEDVESGVTRQDTFYIEVSPNAPIANAGEDTSIQCGSPVLDYDATGFGSSGNGTEEDLNYSYLWTSLPGNGNVSPFGEATLMPSFAGGDTYFLAVTDNATGCVARDTILVVSASFPGAAAGEDVSFDCNSTTITLDASEDSSLNPEFIIQWNILTGNGTITDGETLMPTVDAPGFYELTLTNESSNCTGRDTIEIIDMTIPPSIVISSMGSIGCSGTNGASLDGTGSDEAGDITYEWKGPSGNLISPTLIATTQEGGMHYFCVTNNTTGCTGIDSVFIDTDMGIPNADAGGNMTITCATSSVILDGTMSDGADGTGDYSYQWIGTDGQTDIDNANTLMPTINSPGTYELSVTNNDNNCSAVSSVVVDMEMTEPMVDAGEDATIDCGAGNVTLDASNSMAGLDLVWTSASGLNDPMPNNTTTIIVSAVDTYYLTGTDPANGCMGIDTVVVMQGSEQPIAEIATAIQIDCNTPTTTLDASASSQGDDYIYEWSGPCIDDETNPLMIIVSCGGDYTLTVTDTVAMCMTSTMLTVIENTNDPVADVVSPVVIPCDSEMATLDATASSGTGMANDPTFTYAWTAIGTGTMVILDGNENTLTPNVQGAGTYGLLITNTENGCTATAAATVTQDNPPTADAGLDQELDCDDTFALLTGTNSSAGTYQWTNSAGNTDDIDQPTFATTQVFAPGTYYLSVTGDNNCTAIDSVMVVYAPNDVVANAGEDMGVGCDMNPVTLDGTGSDATDVTYEWTTVDGTFESTDLTQNTVDAATVGEYVLTVTNTLTGCVAQDTVMVFFDDSGLELPIVEIIKEICEPTAELMGNLPAGTTGVWTTTATNAQIDDVNAANTFVTGINEQEILFTWTLSTADCPDYASADVFAYTEATPNAVEDTYTLGETETELAIDVVENDVFTNVDSYTFELLSEPALGTLSNDVGDGTFTYNAVAGIAGVASFQYVVCNTTCTALCDTATVIINLSGEVDVTNLPNGITPNEDGMNDELVFDILTDPEKYPENEIVIFNRWGDVVYQAKPYLNDWNGVNKSGQTLPDGTYYYILRLDLANSEVLQGDVTVLK